MVYIAGGGGTLTNKFGGDAGTAEAEDTVIVGTVQFRKVLSS